MSYAAVQALALLTERDTLLRRGDGATGRVAVIVGELAVLEVVLTRRDWEWVWESWRWYAESRAT